MTSITAIVRKFGYCGFLPKQRVAKMNREQAKEVLANGDKLTHTRFTNEEWVKSMGDGMYIFEDGVMCNVDSFWSSRRGESFNKNWRLFNSREIK